MPFSMLEAMRTAPRWLIYQNVPQPGKKARKVPHYADGAPRQGSLDTPADIARLVTYDAAVAALQGRGQDWGLGFALGPDGTGNYWQGIDLDDVEANDLVEIANTLPGYVEYSPSGMGAHAIGYGATFDTLGSNGTGVEAYCKGRFFTFTGNAMRDSK